MRMPLPHALHSLWDTTDREADGPYPTEDETHHRVGLQNGLMIRKAPGGL